jgi:hypothetical protein
MTARGTASIVATLTLLEYSPGVMPAVIRTYSGWDTAPFTDANVNSETNITPSAEI